MNDWVRESIQRVRAFFHREELDREFDEEMAAHLGLATKENLERGMSVNEARRQALIRFGGTQQAKENHREARALPVVDALLQHVSFGARMLGKNFSFTGIAVHRSSKTQCLAKNRRRPPGHRTTAPQHPSPGLPRTFPDDRQAD